MVALIAYQASRRLPAEYARLAITAARTSLLLINFGFWIGSLWGDPLMLIRSLAARDVSSTLMTNPSSGLGIQRDVGGGVARCWILGRSGKSTLAGQPRRRLQWYSFLYSMV
jgi:hypothetical protein